MKIDGISIGHRGDKLAWAFLFQLNRSSYQAEDVDSEGFIQGSVGPESFDITPSCIDYEQCDCWVICDRDEKGSIRFVDDRGMHWIADRELYEAAERIRPDRYLFIDWNYPEVVYRGSREDFERIADNGGYPRVFHGAFSPDGKRAMVAGECVDIVEIDPTT